MNSNNLMKIVQVGILVSLIVVAALLYGIWKQKSEPIPAAPVSQTDAKSPTLTQEESSAPTAPSAAPTPEPPKQVVTESASPVILKPAATARKPVTKKAPDAPKASAKSPEAPPLAQASNGPAAPLSQVPIPPPTEAASHLSNVPQQPVAAPPPKPVTVPAGTNLAVRLMETLSTTKNHAGDPFTAILDDAIIVDGILVADKGANLTGRVLESTPSGRVKGLAQLILDLTRLQTTGGSVDIVTDSTHEEAKDSKKDDAKKVGIMTGIGAIIGGIAGGGKGAAIGAASGAGAGAGTVLVTKGKEIQMEREARLMFQLREPFTVTLQNQAPASDHPAKERRRLNSDRF